MNGNGTLSGSKNGSGQLNKSIKAFAAATVIGIASNAALGQGAYKCVEKGKAVFSDQPCATPQARKPEPVKMEKTAEQIQKEFEAEQADIKEGERLRAEIEANRALSTSLTFD